MAHHHRLGLGREEINSEKRQAYLGPMNGANEQQFTRKANKQFIEKQHFQWNKSFDLSLEKISERNGGGGLTKCESLTDVEPSPRSVRADSPLSARPVTSVDQRATTPLRTNFVLGQFNK